MSPMPFWPSFDPCAKLTPVHVRIRTPRIHGGGGSALVGSAEKRGVAGDERATAAADRPRKNPTSGEMREGVADLARLRPVDAAGARSRQYLIGEADADDRADQGGASSRLKPLHHVPRFQMIAPMSSANTIAKPDPDPTFDQLRPAAAR